MSSDIAFPRPVQAAIDAGYAVVPADRNKRPRVAWKQWQDEPQTPEDLALLGHGSIWAVITGARSNTVVLDFDGPDGLATMRALGLTAHVRTPSGAHVYVQHPGYPVRNIVRHEDHPGLDIRGDGGVAYFYGRSTKGAYEPLEWPPAPLPVTPDLADIFSYAHAPERTGTVAPGSARPSISARKFVDRKAQDIMDAPPGTSNLVTNKASYSVGGLVASGQVSESEAYETLLSAALARGVGKPSGVIRSGLEAGAEAPWVIDEDPEDDDFIDVFVFRSRNMKANAPGPVPFPTDALPTFLPDFVREAASALAVPESYVGTALLPVLGTAIGGYVSARVRNTWEESANLWAALVGKPGTAKTPTLKMVMAPIKDLQREAYRIAVAQAAERDVMVDPMLTQMVIDDVTLEALQKVHAANPRGLIMQPDELKGWISGMGQYKSGGGSDRQQWLSAWSRQTIVANRVSRSTVYIDKPYISVLGGIQPDVLEGLVHGSDDGLLPRLIFTIAEPNDDPIYEDDDISLDTLARYDTLWHDLRDFGEQERIIDLSSNAREMFFAWRNANKTEGLAQRDSLREVWDKAPAQCIRIALILALTEGEDQITTERLAAAIELTRYYQGQSVLIADSAEAGTPYERKNDARVQTVLALINANPGITWAGVTAIGPTWLRDHGTNSKIFKTLDTMGLAPEEG